MRLHTRYTLTILGLVGLILVMVSATQLTQSRQIMESMRGSSAQVMSDALQRQLREQGLILTELLGGMLANPLYNYELDTIRDIARPTLRMPEVVSVQVYDESGTVVHDGTDTLASFGDVFDDPETRRTLERGETVVWLVGDSIHISGPIRAAPGASALGGVRLVVSSAGVRADIAALGGTLAEIRDRSVSNQLAATATIACIAGLVALALGIAVARSMSKPIGALAALSRRIGRGEFPEVAPAASRDEVSELARAMHQMAHDLRETTVSKDYVDDILDSMQEPLFVVGAGQRILTANKAAMVLLGYEAEGLIGQPVSRVTRCRRRPFARGEFPAGVLAQDDEGELIAADGRHIPALISTAPLLHGTHSNDEYVVLGRDITERKRVENELRRAKDEAVLASRSKSEFLANMSHELRTPLNAIIGFSEIIHSEVFGTVEPTQYRNYAEDIHESGHYLLSIINDILDMSKIEAGKLKLEPAWWNLNDLIDASLRLVAPRAEERELTLSAEVDETLEIHADARTVKQILVNLLSNAIKFTPDHGRISVRARVAPDGVVRIAVRDTGIGIDRKHIETVMSPFGQVADSKTRDHEGTGLGLALVVSLTELHDGSFRLFSRVGQGTTAVVTLPSHRLRVRALAVPEMPEAGAA